MSSSEERLDELEAEVAFLREMIKSLIARFPAHPLKDAPMFGTVKAFNEASKSLPEPQASARARAVERFDMQHLKRVLQT
ncbi:MAG TPA: hypothetical protein VGH80_05445 [Xanthomonadaceae bacterium]|jgi:hypothetical protein